MSTKLALNDAFSNTLDDDISVFLRMFKDDTDVVVQPYNALKIAKQHMKHVY